MCRVQLILLTTISSLFFIGCADAFVVPIHHGPRHLILAPLTLQSQLEQEVELPTTDVLSTTEPNLDPALGITLHTALDQITDMMMDDSFVQEFPVESVRDLFRNCIERVEVKTSSIPNAGRGLFAVQDIPAGQIVSFYPVHTLGVTLPDDGGTYSVQHVEVDDDTKHKNHKNTNQRSNNNNDNGSINNHAHNAPNENESQSDGSYTLYLIGGRPLAGVYVEDLCEGSRPFVDVDLEQLIRPGWMAHFINDGAIVTRPNDTSYYEKSLAAQNCVLIPLGPAPLLVAVTTKPVPKGAELFVSYFYTYWMDALLGATSKEDGTATSEVHSNMPPPKLETIKQQEVEASREVVNAMEALQNAYAEESHALEVAFDAFLATRDKRMIVDPNNDNEVPVRQHRSSPWLLVPQIVGRLCRRIYNKIFQRGSNNNNRPSFGQ
jgi:hypothetical protein